jgi:hypothetical protein
LAKPDSAADPDAITESKPIAQPITGNIIIGICFTESISLAAICISNRHAERERNAHVDAVSEPRPHRDASFIIDSNNVAFGHAFTVKSTFSRWIAAPRLRKNSRSSGV